MKKTKAWKSPQNMLVWNIYSFFPLLLWAGRKLCLNNHCKLWSGLLEIHVSKVTYANGSLGYEAYSINWISVGWLLLTDYYHIHHRSPCCLCRVFCLFSSAAKLEGEVRSNTIIEHRWKIKQFLTFFQSKKTIRITAFTKGWKSLNSNK